MTKFTAYAVYLMGAMYVVLFAFVLLGGWRLKSEQRRVRLIWFLLLPTALFVTFWFAGRWIWTIFYWLFVFGDAGPYEEYASFTSAFVALVISGTVFARLALGRINRRYLRITSWGIAASAALILIVLTHEFTHRIYAWTARDAAENYLARVRVAEDHPPNAPRRIVEVATPTWEHNPRMVRRFILYYGKSPTQEVRVSPYGWWWWTLSGSGPAYITELDWAVDHWESDREEATKQLNEIVSNHPGTVTSQMAERTLEMLEREGPPRWKSK